ncbi:MAG: tetratricopeptide repeat protein [Phycisphaerae bacterium]|nr:tetratricopeptide repeat protein [Phycisphaerae bacterium]
MNKTCMHALVVLMLVVAGILPAVAAGSRRVQPGDVAPEFSVRDLAGQTYTYTPQGEKALMVMFLSAKQASSFKAQTDLVRILGGIQESAKAMDVVIALDDPNAFSSLTRLKPEYAGQMVVTLDEDHHLWGRFGAIAMPTLVVVNTQGQVVGFEAGYGYNFSPVIHDYVNKALGLETNATQASLTQVDTVSNGTQAAKLSRLLKAADMMAAKGHLEVAIVEVKKASAMDPNAIDIRLALAELYCKASKGQEALDTLQDIKGRSPSQNAKILLISGWAHRQMGHLDKALDVLVRATELAPRDARVFYELGRIYELKGLKDEALNAYRHALTLLF